ncbi:RNA-binding domain-containing protein [Candidatus Omnitrophota bacterium]
MTKDLTNLLIELIKKPHETEWLEFKEAKNSFSFESLGQYLSALSNEANLKGQHCGWLILGVQDKIPREIVGTLYKSDEKALDRLKQEIAQHTNGISFQEIFEITHKNKRILMFQIPAAPAGIITLWKGHAYGRDGEALGALREHEREQIRQVGDHDWSAEFCSNASIDDLDIQALDFARAKFIGKNKDNLRFNVKEAEKWDDMLFLEKILLARKGRLTKAAILLLGKPEAASILTPHLAQITWKLETEEEAYEHFGPPFLLSVNAVFQKLRNVNFRIQPFNQLIPVELKKYDSKIVLEALNNCIAHQDYQQNARIIIIEKIDRIILRNIGSFYDGTVDEYVFNKRKPERYRNPILIQAMVHLDMIDTMGMGIRRMFSAQRERFFPLPEYDFKDMNHVEMTIYGRLIDENYSRILMEEKDLTLDEVMLLDCVQKKKTILPKQIKHLRNKKLIEGRAPNIHLSGALHRDIGEKATYIKTRGFDNDYYEKLVLEYLKKFSNAGRKEMNALLLDKLPDVLNVQQKNKKISNILFVLSNKKGLIVNNSKSTRYPIWILTKG